MSAPLQFVPLHAGDHLAICDVCCRAHRHGYTCAKDETTSAHTLAFVRRGIFSKAVNGQEFLADSNQVVFFNCGEEYKIAHPVDGGDDCTVFQLQAELAKDVAASLWPQVADRPDRPFLFTHAPCDQAIYMLLERLRHRIRHAALDELMAEELTMVLLAATLRSAATQTHHRLRTARVGTDCAHREIVESTQLLLSQTFSQSLGLFDISRLVHCSPFHLARIFRAILGVPLHQYRNRLRLREALRRIGEGELDLAKLAVEIGFSSHSHLSDAFREAFGISPAGCRRVATNDRLREMSKNLEAVVQRRA